MIIDGKAIKTDRELGVIYIKVPFNRWDRLDMCGYENATVLLHDKRLISRLQQKKVHALIRDIGNHVGYFEDECKDIMKNIFIERYKMYDFFSFENCSKETATEFIEFLLTFCIEWNITMWNHDVLSFTSDVERQIYACLYNGRCIICSDNADLHHFDAVGMGRNRNTVNHKELRCLPLCRKCHNLSHVLGQETFVDRYHLEPVPINDEIIQLYMKKNGRAELQKIMR